MYLIYNIDPLCTAELKVTWAFTDKKAAWEQWNEVSESGAYRMVFWDEDLQTPR